MRKFEHVRSAADLVTPYAATRAGFVRLALEKNRQATPLVAAARALKVRASAARSPTELLRMDDIKPALLAAAGVSDKAASHMDRADQAAAIQGLVEQFLDPAGAQFVEELVYRFLLTRGDTLGGSMRNIAGALGQRQFARAVISALGIANRPFQWQHQQTMAWTKGNAGEADVENVLRGIGWGHGKRGRTLLFNVKLPLTNCNIDVVLLGCECGALKRQISNMPTAYVALGELKGGIDPAGADEHWKTARSALLRIHEAFAANGLRPKSFFIGAAIVESVADNVWTMLQARQLDNAANLTDADQVAAVAQWLCSL